MKIIYSNDWYKDEDEDTPKGQEVSSAHGALEEHEIKHLRTLLERADILYRKAADCVRSYNRNTEDLTELYRGLRDKADKLARGSDESQPEPSREEQLGEFGAVFWEGACAEPGEPLGNISLDRPAHGPYCYDWTDFSPSQWEEMLEGMQESEPWQVYRWVEEKEEMPSLSPFDRMTEEQEQELEDADNSPSGHKATNPCEVRLVVAAIEAVTILEGLPQQEAGDTSEAPYTKTTPFVLGELKRAIAPYLNHLAYLENLDTARRDCQEGSR